jgi:hypothetical protein
MQQSDEYLPVDSLDILLTGCPRQHCSEEEFKGRLTYTKGDFFKPLPQEAQGADVVTMKVGRQGAVGLGTPGW